MVARSQSTRVTAFSFSMESTSRMRYSAGRTTAISPSSRYTTERVCASTADASDATKFSPAPMATRDRKSTRLNSSHSQISYAVFCLKKKIKIGMPREHHPPHGRPLAAIRPTPELPRSSFHSYGSHISILIGGLLDRYGSSIYDTML